MYLLGVSAFYGESLGGHYDSVPQALLQIASESSSHDLSFVGPNSQGEEKTFELARVAFRRLQNPVEIFFTQRDAQLVADFVSLHIRRRGAQGVFVYEGHLLWLSIVAELATRFPTVSFIVNIHHVDFMLVGWDSRVSRKVIRDLIAAASRQNNIGICFESEFLQELFKDDKQAGLGTFPIVSDVSVIQNIDPIRRGLLVTFSGISRKNKNFVLDFLQNISLDEKSVTLLRPPKLIRDHASSDFAFIDEFLTKEKFSGLFQSVEEVWFFSFWKMNYFGSSGRLADAISANAIPVVPKGSALHKFCSIHASNYLVFSPSMDGVGMVTETLIGDKRPTGPQEALKRIVDLCSKTSEEDRQGLDGEPIHAWKIVLANLLVRIRIRFLSFFRDPMSIEI